MEKLKKFGVWFGTVVAGAALSVLFKAWIGGDSLKGLKSIGPILKTGVPFWLLLVFVLISISLVPYWRRSIRKPKPTLFTSWRETSGWGWGGIQQRDGSMENVLAIHGDVIITTENIEGLVTLVDVRLKGAKRASNFMPIVVKGGATFEQKIVVFFRGLTPKADKPFVGDFTFIDNKGREYPVSPVELRALPTSHIPFAPNMGPNLLASWAGNSVWGWASTSFVDEGFRTYMIRGEVTFLLENAKEAVHIVGVEIEGAKTMGAFENFDLPPGKTVKQSLKLYFQGTAPEGTHDYEVGLIFIDIKGNKYPTKAHRFIPLPIPERVAEDRREAALKRLQR